MGQGWLGRALGTLGEGVPFCVPRGVCVTQMDPAGQTPPTVHLRSLPFWGSSLHRSSPKEKLETNLEPQRVTSKLRCSRVTGPEGCGSRLNASQRKVDW